MEYIQLEEKIKSYNPNANFEIIKKAYDFALEAHKEQRRASGEPYFIHPFSVAMTLADFQLDATSIVAGLLHDVVEDTKYTLEDIDHNFGQTMALIIDGVTKLSKLSFKTKEECAAENLRKMLFAMVKDIRVILVKIADRLNNIRTIKSLPVEKQKRIAQETLDIYAPLSNRLGMHNVKVELEDLCFRICEPEIAYELETKLVKDKTTREEYIEDIIAEIQKECNSNNIECKLSGRPKHLYSIYKKLKSKDKTIEDIYDLIGVRVLVGSINDCYAVLGIVHKLWKPIMGRFKDYIAVPKTNMYQSLHTTIMHPKGEPVEVQIRTFLMDRIAEDGIAAHWNYKEAGSRKPGESSKEEVAWLRQLVNWHRDVTDAREYIETIKVDLYQDEVFVFTPNGDIRVLTAHSTPIDFAYLIHTEVGHKCVGAKVNGKMVPIDYELKNGDIVDILTSNTARPSKDWLKIVKSAHARSKVKAWFKNEERSNDFKKGRDSFIDYFNGHIKDIVKYYEEHGKNPFITDKEKLPPKDEKFVIAKEDYEITKFFKSKLFISVINDFELKNSDDFFVMVGRGEFHLKNFFAKMFPDYSDYVLTKGKTSIQNFQKKAPEKKPKAVNGVIVSGLDDVMVRFSKCCTPVPGDPILGFVTRGRGVSIHRRNCPNISTILSEEKDRMIEVAWDESRLNGNNITYATQIRVKAIDRPHLIFNVTTLISNLKFNIYELHARIEKNFAILEFTIDITNIGQLQELITNLEKVDGVMNVYRIEAGGDAAVKE
ncbi:MAG: bifunctional (p)ppGpp synthetase/guanosine-3',5'-bis(diphosphate) 3'-pyrophosphohydrolase [Candidatus Wallbacteria bacterium]